LLESAGFSKANPYYIVPQGRVTEITNMKDAERLTILKDVAGTQVYEARRAESLKIMAETNNKRSKIDELLEYIKERLAELEEEKEELRGYQEKEKERRCLEYAYYSREQTALQNALDEIEEARLQGGENTDGNQKKFMDGEQEITDLEDEIKKLKRDMELLKLERRQMEDERRETAKKKATSEMEVKNLTDGLSATEQARTRHRDELKAVKHEIASKEAELEKIIPDYNNRKAKEAEVKHSLDTSEAARRRLYEKQGRSAQFKSKAERDKFLRNEIEELNATLGEQKANRINATEEVKALKSNIKKLEAEVDGLREQHSKWDGDRQALVAEIATAKDTLERLQEERKAARREDDKLESAIVNARNERDKFEGELSHSMDNSLFKGLATVRRLKREHNITGAYGTLAELMDVGEDYRVAAEQTAGNSLFHYIVDNAETASQLVDALYKQKGGRVTFVPLSQLRIRPTKLPKAGDAVPMISKIKFDKKYEKAFEQVFGKTIICPNLQVAGQYARSHGCNAITPDGDTTNRKGAMTGGYIDTRKSRLETVRAVTKWQDEYESLRQRVLEIREGTAKRDQEVTGAMSDLQKLEQKLRLHDDGYEPLKRDIRVKSAQVEKLKTQLEGTEKRKETVENLLKEYADSISGFEAEMASEFKKALSASEEHTLEQLNTELQELQKQWNELSKSRRELESRKKLLEIDLRENLRLKLDNLDSQEFDTNASSSSGNLKEAQRDLKRITKQAAAIEAKIQEAEAQIEAAEVKVTELEKEKNEKEVRQGEIAKEITRHQKMMEKSVQKKATYSNALADCAKNIRNLGVLPEEAFERFATTDSKKV